MDIHANTTKNINNPVTLTLSGAPAGVVQEVRMQNSLNGVESVYTGTAGADGTLSLPIPQGFGGHFSFTVRSMIPGQADKVDSFRLSGQDGDAIHFASFGSASSSPHTVTSAQAAPRSVVPAEVK